MRQSKRPIYQVFRALSKETLTIEELSRLVYGDYDKYYHNCIYCKIRDLRLRGYIIKAYLHFDGNTKLPASYRLYHKSQLKSIK